MTEKDFAKMTRKELEEYCNKLQQELSTAQWFLRIKIKLGEREHSN